MSLETPTKIRTLQRKLYRKAKDEPGYRFYLLYDKMYREDILIHAYELAKSNQGAPGRGRQKLHGHRVERAEEVAGRDQGPTPHKVVSTSICPTGSDFETWGGERPLGIPTIRDRVAQTAATLVLESIFERDFPAQRHGFRPNRGCKDALRRVDSLLEAGSVTTQAGLQPRSCGLISGHSQMIRVTTRDCAMKGGAPRRRAWYPSPCPARERLCPA